MYDCVFAKEDYFAWGRDEERIHRWRGLIVRGENKVDESLQININNEERDEGVRE